MIKILLFRFSAMGDVVMLLPVLKGILASNTNVELYFLTQKTFFPFFEGVERLNLVEVDLKGRDRSLSGLFKLFKELRRTVNPDYVVDLHSVIRTRVLSLYFSSVGFKVIGFNKGTFQKFRAVRSKQLNQLPCTIERYKAAFCKIGLQVELGEPPLFQPKSVANMPQLICNCNYLIGIAPFAKHRQKIWGVDKVDDLIERLNNSFSCNILLFGGGSAEIEALDCLAAKYSNCVVVAKYFRLGDEIQVIQKLDVMLSMDSANMHIAAMGGVPTVSVWGATHPSLGFGPYKQPDENIIQYSGNELSCRPCSVYGSRKCQYGDDIRCMNYIPVENVFNRISEILGKKYGSLD